MSPTTSGYWGPPWPTGYHHSMRLTSKSPVTSTGDTTPKLPPVTYHKSALCLTSAVAVVQVNTSVREINLKSNKIGDEGATAIGEALKVPAWLCCIAGAPLPRDPPLPRYPRRDSGTQDYTSVYASNNIESATCI
jgi:hypothetical protein